MHLANFLFLFLTEAVARSQAVDYITFTMNVGVEASGLPEVNDGKGGKKPGDHFVSVYMQKGFNPFEGLGTTETQTGGSPVWRNIFTFKHVKDSDQSLRFKLWHTGDDKEDLLAERTLTLKELCDRNFNRVQDRYSVISENLSPDSPGTLHIKSRIAAEDLNGRSSGDSIQTRKQSSVLPYNILVVLTLGYFLQHSISTPPNLQSHLA